MSQHSTNAFEWVLCATFLEPGEGDLCYSKVPRAGLTRMVSGPCGQAQDSRKLITEKWRDPAGEESLRRFLEKYVAGDVRVNRE